MNAPVVFQHEAREELREVYRYYLARNKETARNFSKAVQAVVERIAKDPECYPIRDGFRRCVMTKFPTNEVSRAIAYGIPVLTKP